MWQFGVFILSALAVACAGAIFAPRYRDNLAQRVGLGGITIWCASKAWGVWEVHAIGVPTLWLACSLAFMAAGTWAKIIHYSRLEEAAAEGNL